MSTRVIGIDASWTGTGVTALTIDGKTVGANTARFGSSPKPGVSQSERMDQLCGAIMTFVMQHAPLPIEALVAMESYAHAAKFGRELAGELGGHIKWLLWRAGYTVVLVPPSTLKLFVTGKGNAAKDQVMMAVLKRWGFESPNNDVADSYGLARFAQSLGEPTQSVAVSAMAKKCTKLAGGTPA